MRSLDSNYGKEVVRDGMNAMGGIHWLGFGCLQELGIEEKRIFTCYSEERYPQWMVQVVMVRAGGPHRSHGFFGRS